MLLTQIKKSKKQTIIDFVHERFSENRDRMQNTYRQWMLNLAWVRGFQNTDFSNVSKRFQTNNNKEPWKVRLVSNLMLPIMRRMVSQLTYIKPVWDVIPATSDQADIQIAEQSVRVLQDLWQRTGMNKKLIRLLSWQSVCSNAFLKGGWDSDLGDEITVQRKELENETIDQLMEFYGIETIPDEITTKQGDVFIDVVTPFNITLDDVPTLEDSDWIIESQLRSKDWVIQQYGSKWDKLTETSDHDLYIYPFIQRYTEQGARLPRNGILVHEIFIRRCSQFQDGLHAVLVGSEPLEFLVTPKENPYDHKELPYAHFLEIYDPASLWGTCAVEQIRPNQARYNRISSALMEQMNQMANAQWMKPRQAGKISFTNRPGGVLEYNYPYKPEQTQLTPIPAYVERLADRTRADIQDTSSSHDVSEAKVEPGVRSGRAVLALQDADDSVLGPTLIWMDESLARIGRLALQTIIQNVDNERHIEVMGDFNETEIVSFSGESLLGKSDKGNYWNVRVKTFGRQILSRSGRENLVQTLINVGVLNPLTQKNLILHILGTADLISIYDENSMDRTRQWKEIKAIVSGEQVHVYPAQNHEVHIEVIKKFISSSHWDQLDEQQKQLVVQHFVQHQTQFVNELMFAQLYAAQRSGGMDLNNGREQRTTSSNGKQAAGNRR